MFRIIFFVGLFFIPFELPGQEKKEPTGAETKEKMAQMQRTMLRLFYAASSPMIRQELEISDVQRRQMEKLQQQFHRGFAEINRKQASKWAEVMKLKKEGKEKESQQLREELQKMSSDYSKKVLADAGKVLLKHQIKRINEISRQDVLRGTNEYGDVFGIPIGLARELKMTKREKDKLREVTELARAEYYKKVDELKEKSLNKIMNSLTAEQRSQLKATIGEIFDESRLHRKLINEKKTKRSSQKFPSKNVKR